jgi:hypothetical protein
MFWTGRKTVGTSMYWLSIVPLIMFSGTPLPSRIDVVTCAAAFA